MLIRPLRNTPSRGRVVAQNLRAGTQWPSSKPFSFKTIGCSPPSAAGQACADFRLQLLGLLCVVAMAHDLPEQIACLDKRFASPSIGRWTCFSARTFARFMTSVAPISIAENTARQWLEITAKYQPSAKSNHLVKTDQASSLDAGAAIPLNLRHPLYGVRYSLSGTKTMLAVGPEKQNLPAGNIRRRDSVRKYL